MLLPIGSCHDRCDRGARRCPQHRDDAGMLGIGSRVLTTQQQLAFDIYKELVEINTVTATGDTARAAEAMAVRLRAAGFADADVRSPTK